MQYGLSPVLKCPHCGKLVQRATIMSGNSFGAVLWSDGRCVMPMMPDQPPLGKCSGCRGIFRISAARVVGHVEPLDAAGLG